MQTIHNLNNLRNTKKSSKVQRKSSIRLNNNPRISLLRENNENYPRSSFSSGLGVSS